MAIQEPATHQLALLVEGDPEIDQALRKVLEPRAWEIVLSAGTTDALEQVKLRQFGLIENEKLDALLTSAFRPTLETDAMAKPELGAKPVSGKPRETPSNQIQS